MENKMKLTFLSGAGEVSGVSFLLEGAGKKILMDAGFHSGCHHCEKVNSETLPYKPSEIDIIFVTQSHLEHSGQIPRLVKEGFKGVIYSTSETKFITELIYLDYVKGTKDSKELYNEEDIKKTMALWEPIYYGEKIDLSDGLEVKIFDAGHVLGSSMVYLKYNNKTLLFANSVGNKFVRKLSGMSEEDKINYLVIESVYGNKIHETSKTREEYIENIIENTINRQGTVFLPVPSVDKIYTVLKEIHDLMAEGRIPKVPVFIDSPLAAEAVSIYGVLFKCKDKKIQCGNLDEFVSNFEGVKFVTEEKEIQEMEDIKGPKIIINGVNTSTKKSENHLLRYVSNPNNSIIFIDYQIVGSLGRKLQEGLDVVEIGDEKVKVLAQIETIDGYSAHADHNRLFMFVDDIKVGLEKVFAVVGEPKASMYLVQRLKDYMGVNATYPKKGTIVELDFE